jgi:disease resistance protein RPM1
MAEGFLKKDGDKRLEEVAVGYLTELIRRNLVQVVSISADGRAKSCRVHDLVHATILGKCEDLSFCKNIRDNQKSSITGMVRRLSIDTISDDLMESIENSNVRSLHVLTTPKTSIESFATKIPTKYKRLKVLVLENEELLEVPNDLGCLSHLKYFSFSGKFDGDFSLPKSIGMLENLETMDLTQTLFDTMPKEICKLRNLRHFIGYKLPLIQLKDGIGGMTSLQTLRDVCLEVVEDEDEYEDTDENDKKVVELIQELGKLEQLRELVLLDVEVKYMSAISSSVNKMVKMEKLHISARQENIVIHLNSLLPMLRNLRIDGNFEIFPVWISKLKFLVRLKLEFSYPKQTNDVMKIVKNMPQLSSLVISCSNFNERLESLHFQDGWFRNLKELCIKSFLKLSYIIIDEGALVSLKKLRLYSMPELKRLPTGIQHLQKLEYVRIISVSEAIMKSIARGEGKWIFKQVPFVEIRYIFAFNSYGKHFVIPS